MTKLSIAILTCLCSVSLAQAQNKPAEPQVWVAALATPADPKRAAQSKRPDAADQWKQGAPWNMVASHTRVAKLISGNIEAISDEALRAMIDNIKLRRFVLALEIGPLVRSADCQGRNEAFGNPGETEAILRKIQRNGGDLQYLAMDEPYFYGHKDGSGCHFSATQIAQQVAASVASMRRIFPKLQVGDTEVTDADRTWATELAQWTDAYRAATQEPLAFFHADVAWSKLAIRNLAPLDQAMKQRRIPFGIIYNADRSGDSDIAFTRSAVRNFLEIETVLKIHPEMVLFQTWTTYPSRVLPESQPGTLTHLALEYLQPASTLRLARAGGEISGTLTGADGAGIANARLMLTAIDVSGRMLPTSRHFAGTVPPGAVKGVIGIRAGNEGSCICAGPTSATVGMIHYREQSGGKPPQDVPSGAQPMALNPTKPFGPNLREFAVTPGAEYSFDAPIAAAAAADGAGYVTLIFLDAAGKGLEREFLWFKPSERPLGLMTSDVRGSFRKSLDNAVAGTEIRAEFEGGRGEGPALAVLAPVDPPPQ